MESPQPEKGIFVTPHSCVAVDVRKVEFLLAGVKGSWNVAEQGSNLGGVSPCVLADVRFIKGKDFTFGRIAGFKPVISAEAVGLHGLRHSAHYHVLPPQLRGFGMQPASQLSRQRQISISKTVTQTPKFIM